MEAFYKINIRSLWDYFKSEQKVFWLINFYMLLEYVRPQSVYPVLDVLPFAQLTLIFLMIALLSDKDRKKVSNIENKLIVLYFLTIILSSIFAYYPETSMEHIQDFLIWFIVYFLIISIVNTEKRFFVFFLFFLIYSFKMSQHGFLSWALRGFAFADWGVTGGPGWFHNSGEFGIQLCIFIPMSLYFIIALKQYWGKYTRLFFYLLPFTAFASVIATSSRGALVGTIAALFWMLLKSKTKVKSMFAIIIVSTVVYVNIPEESLERFNSAGSDKTSVQRLTRWSKGIEMMNNHPVLGVGYANWSPYTSRFSSGDHSFGLSHNIFVDAGAELGYTGLFLFILMIIYCFVNNSRTRKQALQKKNDFIFWIAHGLDAALVGFLVSASFVSVLYYPYFWILMSFIVALNNVAGKTVEKSPGTLKDNSHKRKHRQSGREYR